MALASPAYAVGECPSLPGASSADCSVLITVNPDGSFTATLTGVGPYDGAEDSLVGVINNGPGVLTDIFLAGPDIFGFDGDGQALYSGISYGPTGYEGPGVSFFPVDSDSGTVSFAGLPGGGIAVGGTAWFALEEDLSRVGGITTIASAPEPATWAMMLLGFGAVGFQIRRTRHVKLSYRTA